MNCSDINLSRISYEGQVAVRTLGRTKSFGSVVFSHDSKLLAIALYNNTIRVWNTATGLLQQTLERYTDRVSSVVFSHGLKLLASASDNKTVRVSLCIAKLEPLLQDARSQTSLSRNLEALRALILDVHIERTLRSIQL